MSRLPTEEEFNEWLLHPVTVAVRRVLDGKREESRRAWEGGSYSDWNDHAHAVINAGAIGECRGYAFTAEMTYETFLGEIDDEHERAKAPRQGGTGTGV